jgi:hypothetical protein
LRSVRKFFIFADDGLADVKAEVTKDTQEMAIEARRLLSRNCNKYRRLNKKAGQRPCFLYWYYIII